jgi:hypothetical protein
LSMNGNEEGLLSIMSDPLGALKVEDLVVEAAWDPVKDEIKRCIQKRLDEDPRLRDGLQRAISGLLEAKVRETNAMAKLGKCGGDLGDRPGARGPQEAQGPGHRQDVGTGDRSSG